MKVTIATVLVFLAYAKARSFEPKNELPSVFGYLEKSVVYAEERRKAEEAYLTNQRIIGGSAALLGQFPYQAGLLLDIRGSTGVCGGSLVTPTRIITAAHCWFDGMNQVTSVAARLGTVLVFGNDGVTTPRTDNVVVHPDWFPTLIRNDVAVIYLPNAVPLSSTIATISLPTGSELQETFSGETAIVSGYGLTGPASGISQILRYVSVSVMTNLECEEYYSSVILQLENVCTSGVGVVGACTSDSGGPLAINRNGTTVLIGIVSFVSSNCLASLPSGYARVSSHVDFFTQHMT